MKTYRVSVPFTLHLNVPAESEEQAKHIAVVATITPGLSLFDFLEGDTALDGLNSVEASFWARHSYSQSTEGVEVLETHGESTPSSVKRFSEFVALLGNEEEMKAMVKATGEPVMAA
jgi:hypothetical protein